MTTTTTNSSPQRLRSRKRFRLDHLIDILGITHTSSMRLSSASIKQPLVEDANEFKKTKLSSSSKRFRQRSLLSVEPLVIGGCRQCRRTFTERVHFIHHMVDHFPALFYSFEAIKPETNQLRESLAHAQNASSCSQDLSSISFSSPMATYVPSCSLTMRSTESVKSSLTTLNADLPYYMCPYCCSTFSENGIYQSHLFIHEQPQAVLYSNCRPMISTMSRKIHDGKRIVSECNNPKEVVGEETLCNRHTQQTRSSNDKTCEQCGKIFMSTFDLNLHGGTQGGFSYDCKDCGRCFDTRKALHRHNQTHRTPQIERQRDAFLDTKIEEKPSTSSFRGNIYIASLLSKYSGNKSPGSTHKRSNGTKSSEKQIANSIISVPLKNEEMVDDHKTIANPTEQAEFNGEMTQGIPVNVLLTVQNNSVHCETHKT